RRSASPRFTQRCTRPSARDDGGGGLSPQCSSMSAPGEGCCCSSFFRLRASGRTRFAVVASEATARGGGAPLGGDAAPFRAPRRCAGGVAPPRTLAIRGIYHECARRHRSRSMVVIDGAMSEASHALTLYTDALWISPYAFSAFVTLKEKGLPFTQRSV